MWAGWCAGRGIENVGAAATPASDPPTHPPSQPASQPRSEHEHDRADAPLHDSFIHTEFAAATEIARLRIAVSALREHEKDTIIQYENAVEGGNAKTAWVQALGQIQASAKVLSPLLTGEPERA